MGTGAGALSSLQRKAARQDPSKAQAGTATPFAPARHEKDRAQSPSGPTSRISTQISPSSLQSFRITPPSQGRFPDAHYWQDARRSTQVGFDAGGASALGDAPDLVTPSSQQRSIASMSTEMALGSFRASEYVAFPGAMPEVARRAAEEATQNPDRHSSPAAGRFRYHWPRESRSEPMPGFITGHASNVRSKYTIFTTELGIGHYGVVRKCENRETKEIFALKTVKKARVDRIETLRREIEVLKSVRHPNIIDFVEVFEEERYVHIVTELCTGGELFDHIIQRTESGDGAYSERDAAKLVVQILDAVRYLHEKCGVCHRDLEPENFLFKHGGVNAQVKIIDFGLSRFVDGANPIMSTRVGTPYYIAPEVLQRSYTKACDLWSVGVIIYILLCGYPPFSGESDAQVFDRVRNAPLEFPSPEWDSVSPDAKDLISQLLKRKGEDRPTAAAALEHPWLRRGDREHSALVSVGKRLRKFAGMNKLKKVALNVIAQHLTEDEIGHLKTAFKSLDADGDGSIAVDELENALSRVGNAGLDQDMRRLLESVDVDGSNTLDIREFLAATMDRSHYLKEEYMRRAFDFFDTQRRGRITLHDLLDTFGSMDNAREILGDVDVDNDGEISFEEFRKMMRGADPVVPGDERAGEAVVEAPTGA